LYKEENLRIVREVMSKFGIEKFRRATIVFKDINLIHIKGFLSSSEIYALSLMISKFILEEDGSLESFSL
jgi:hypothetical protein